jgi:hypothetical protein
MSNTLLEMQMIPGLKGAQSGVRRTRLIVVALAKAKQHTEVGFEKMNRIQRKFVNKLCLHELNAT